MAPSVLVPVVSHPPWARAVADTVAEVESPAEVRASLLYVFDEKEREAALETVPEVDPPAAKLAASKSSVEATSATLSDAGFEVEVDGVVGSEESEAILETARADDIDRVYLYNRKRSPVGKTVYGSTVTDVLSNASRPVVVVPAERL